ncbi:MAG: hypothetical protein ACRD15_08940, partial [Vicinamibacterales bacterium]
MSRIQDILNKAERDGTARRTRALPEEPRVSARSLNEEPRVSARSLNEESRVSARSLNNEEYGAPPSPGEEIARSANEAPRGGAREEMRHVRGFVDAPAAPPAEPRPTRVVSDMPRFGRALRNDGAAATAPALAPEPHARFSEQPGVAPDGLDNEEPRVSPRSLDEDAALDTTPRATTELDHLLVAALAPASIAAEQYRSLRTRLKDAENGRSLRAIAVTSPAKGDGKS